MRNIAEQHLKAVVGIVADNHSASTVNGTGFDTRGFESALIIVNSGANGSSGTVDIKMQESSDDAVADAYADISGAAFTQITEANDNTIYVGTVKLEGRERYLRAVAVVGTAACDLGITVVLMGGDVLPPTQVNTSEFNV